VPIKAEDLKAGPEPAGGPAWPTKKRRNRRIRILLVALAAVAGLAWVLEITTGDLSSAFRQTTERFQNDPRRGGAHFAMKPRESDLAGLGTFSGVVKRDDTHLSLAIDASTIRGKDGPAQSLVVKDIRFGLAQLADAQGRWRIAAWSDEYPVNQTIQAAAAAKIPAFQRQIPVAHIPDLNNYWLTARVSLTIDGKETRVFAHSAPLGFK
jgi:hypothetical protein